MPSAPKKSLLTRALVVVAIVANVVLSVAAANLCVQSQTNCSYWPVTPLSSGPPQPPGSVPQ